MAGTLTLTFTGSLVNGEFADTLPSARATTITQTGQGCSSGIVNVGTSEEDLTISDITTEGIMYIKNLDSTNYVTLGPKSGTMVAFMRLKAGEWGFFRLEPGITITLQANTASVKCDIRVYED